MIKALRVSLVLITIAFLIVGISTIKYSQDASAVTGSDWKAGRIIDDVVFYDNDSMTANQIQEFLKAKVPTCDRLRSSTNPTYQPPWTCLHEYQENTTTKENNYGKFNSDGSPQSVSGGKSAARIIWDVAQQYGINPQVLIVMLQKEQSLITDDWPWKIQYDRAMGYACPDSGPGYTASCDSNYYGFYNQVDAAAWQLKRYIQYPNNYNFKAGVTRYIQYSPNPSCGGSNVFIQNEATAALYNYTPYQPNAGALTNLYGTADCGAYGNRNFWRLFNDWFGSTLRSINVSRSLYVSPADQIVGNSVATSFKITNNESYNVSLGRVVVAVRDPNGNIANFSTNSDVVVAPGETYEYYENRIFTKPGKYKMWIAIHRNTANNWTTTWPKSLNDNIIRYREFTVREPNIEISRNLYVSPANPLAGVATATSFKIKNRESVAVNIGKIVVAVRDPSGKNVNFISRGDVTLKPYENYTYYERDIFTKPGKYKMWIAIQRFNGGRWYDDWPKNSYNNIIRYREFNVDEPEVVKARSLYVSPAIPEAGDSTATSFILKNNESQSIDIDRIVVAVRDPDGKIVNFNTNYDILLKPGETYKYYERRTFTKPGKYKMWIAAKPTSTSSWSYKWPLNPLDVISYREFTVK